MEESRRNEGSAESQPPVDSNREENDLSAQVRLAFKEYLEKRAAVRKSMGNLRRTAMFETLPL